MLQQLQQPRRTERPNRYVASDACSPLLSAQAERVVDFLIDRANRRRAKGLSDGSFYRRYPHIAQLARRKYWLPLSTCPMFRTDSPRHEVPRR